VDGEAILLAGERIFNLKRMINNRLGITRKDDDLPVRLKTHARPDGASKGQLPDMAYILKDYYHLRGWNDEGQPSEALKKV